MRRWLQVALAASLLSAACGTTPTQPTSPAPAAPSNPPVAPSLIVIVPHGPFHVGKPGEISYEVIGVNTLAAIAVSSTDGATEFGRSPAPPKGALNLTYRQPGFFTVTVTATTTDGTRLQVSISVNVVE